MSGPLLTGYRSCSCSPWCYSLYPPVRLLIVSSCVTVQIYSSRPSNRNQRRSAEIPASPPPYSPQDLTMTTTTKAPNKYKEKGKELLAKVVFYRQADDKQKLTTNA